MSDFEDLDYYELLGLPRGATADEIRRAFRREIAKYHPDRFTQASPEEQDYAQRRSQRLTEAYAVLSDFAARNAYNLGRPLPQRGAPAPRTPPPPAARDHQAELYAQAQAHLAAGRSLQAIATLRQLQQINPFYRDSAELLSATEAELRSRATPAPAHAKPFRRAPLVAGAASIALVAVVAAVLWQSYGIAQTGAGAADVTASTDLGSVTTAPEPTAVPGTAAAIVAAPTPEPAPPTAAPTAPATLSPPTLAPTPDPTAAPPTPAAETGTVLLSDDFSGRQWAEQRGSGWSVGYDGDRYRIVAAAGLGTIWSYRSVRARDGSVGVDVVARSGEGGLLLRFTGGGAYLAFVIDPGRGAFRLEQHSGEEVRVLAEGVSPAIVGGGEARNRIVARLDGSRIRLLANGLPLAELDLADGPGGAIPGLVAAGGDGRAEVLFDNLEIRELDQR